jgi:hypothetical protein
MRAPTSLKRVQSKPVKTEPKPGQSRSEVAGTATGADSDCARRLRSFDVRLVDRFRRKSPRAVVAMVPGIRHSEATGAKSLYQPQRRCRTQQC